MNGHWLTNCCRTPYMGETCLCCNNKCEPVFRPDPLEQELNNEPVETEVRYNYPEVVMPVYPPRFKQNTDEEFDFHFQDGHEI